MKPLAIVLSLAFASTTFGASATVSTATQLVSALNATVNGDVITLNSGTYSLSSSLHAGSDVNSCIYINNQITIKAAVGASPVIACNDYYGVRIVGSNVTLDGFAVNGAFNFGILAQADSGAISNIMIRRISISMTTSAGQAIGAGSMNDSLIEYCTTASDFDGISLGKNVGATSGSSRNLIISNTIQNATNRSGISVTLGDYNVIAGNSVSNTLGDGILVNGGQHNYIGQNTVTNPHNGITITKDLGSPNRQSLRNFVVNNSLVLNNKAGSDALWFNYDSNYNLGFLNAGTGAAENGMALFNSLGNYVRGNNFYSNPDGGIFVSKDPATGVSGTTTPSFNSIQQNYLHDHPANGGINTYIETQNDFGFNYLSGNPSQIGTPIAGILAQQSVNSNFYSNTIRDIRQGEHVLQSSSGVKFFLNRHFNVIDHYLEAGSSALFDSNSTTLGGNFYSDFTSFSGNPSTGATPYTNIIDLNGNHPVNDRYPYSSESLGKNYSIAVRLPSAGSILATATQKTIAWTSQGCVSVDLYLVNTSDAIVNTIASNTPDYGFYRWTVPNVSLGTYKVRADCKNSSNGATGKSSTGPSFQTTTPDLVLLSPQSNLVIDSGTPMQISWKKTAGIVSVDVYIRYADSQAYQLLAAGVTNDFYTINAPATNSNRVSVRLAYGGYGDSTDGWFTIRASGTGSITTPSSADNLFIGTPALVEWIAPQTTDYVTLDLISGGVTRNIFTQLGDFSSYLMLVPDAPGSGAQLRLSFYTAAGTLLQQTVSAAQNVQNSSAQPNAIAITSGGTQSTPVNTVFSTPLQVLVTNSTGAPVSGASVLFGITSAGAGGSFGGSVTTTVLTNGSGIATAPPLTANGITGVFYVLAKLGDLAQFATFTNTAATASSQVNIGFYNAGNFVLDASGDGMYQNPPTDKYFFYVSQQAGDIAVFGDWNGDGRTKVGIYRDGFWILDYNGNGVYDYDGSAAKDKFYGLGGQTSAGYVPIVGDWNGDGRSKIGFYKAGSWLLDYNGDGSYTDQVIDRFYGFGGNPNEIPILGDWNHDGRTKVGFFYNYNGYGTFVLDYDGNGMYTAADKFYPYISLNAGDKPVFGDWSGNGFTKIGIFRGGYWILDYNGNGVYDYDGTPAKDRFYGFGGTPGERPLVGDWNGDGRSKIGVYHDGFWILDFNGTGSYEGTGAGQDRVNGYSKNSSDQLLIGKW